MKLARDVMSPAVTIGVDGSVEELATLLMERRLDGACVIDDGKLVGVVTSMDLVFQEKNVHLPTMISFLELVLPVGMARAQAELNKVTAFRIEDLMSKDPITAAPETPLADVATWMVEKHLTVVPVVDGEDLLGHITKADVLKAVGYGVKAP